MSMMFIMLDPTMEDLVDLVDVVDLVDFEMV
jgi:hypothetical protein